MICQVFFYRNICLIINLFFMASYTGMSNLQNHPHRSGFDIGRKNAFTAKIGELLPVYWDISMPGDKQKFQRAEYG